MILRAKDTIPLLCFQQRYLSSFMLMCQCTQLYSIEIFHSFLSSAAAEQKQRNAKQYFRWPLNRVWKLYEIISGWDGKIVNPAASQSWAPKVNLVCGIKAPSTLIHFKTKKELNSSRYGYRPHYNTENGVIWKRSPEWSDLKTMPFENAACFLVWTEKTMLSENGDVNKIIMTGRQTTRPWVSKMPDRRYQVASISRADTLKCASVEFMSAQGPNQP